MKKLYDWYFTGTTSPETSTNNKKEGVQRVNSTI